MDFKEAIERIWHNKKYESTSATEVLSHLNEEVAESLKSMLKGDRTKAKQELEDALSCMLIALRLLEIDPVDAVNRQVEAMSVDKEKVMYIYSDRVEIRVGDIVKGGWNLWSVDDLTDALKVAQEFNCKVIKEDFTAEEMVEMMNNG